MKALIVGCGIAGPVVGMFLRRAGIDAVVYEARAESQGWEGSFLNLSPNGLNVLRSLEIEDRVEAIGTPCTGIAFQNRRGRQVGQVDLSGLPELYGTSSLVMRRSRLLEVMLEEARQAGVSFVFGEQFAECDQSAERSITARFESGHSDEANLLIGCDGIHSQTRQVIWPTAPAPAFTGILDVGGCAHVPALATADGELRMIFGHRGFFAYFADDKGDVHWFSHLAPPEVPSAEALSERTQEEWRQLLLEVHRRDPEPIGDILRAAECMCAWPLYDFVPLSRWSEDRVCLVGDAAHANTAHFGQGASVALEDAIVLAKCLRDAGDFQTAFARYEVLRRSRVEQLVQLTRRLGNRKPVSNPVRRWVRDRLLPVFLRLGAKATDEIYSYRVAWREA